MVYSQIAAGGDTGLWVVIISNNVVVNTLPAAQTPGWLSLLWKFAPFVFLALILALILAPRNAGRGTRSIDDRFSHMGKSHARRFDRAKEVQEPRRVPDKSS